DAAGVDLADQDGASANFIQLIHDVVRLGLLDHRTHGNPIRVGQVRYGRRFQTRSQLAGLIGLFAANVVVEHDVLAGNKHAIEAANQHVQSGRLVPDAADHDSFGFQQR